MNIRHETSVDTQAIAEVNWRAFGDMAEPQIIALARQHSSFDPAWSLVAEQDDCVVGHVLFLRQRMRLMGAEIAAVSLGPIAILPEYQKQGIGAELIKAGHARAREQGYVLSFLLGHDTYYPRFGYRVHQHGTASVEITHEMLSAVSSVPLQTRAVTHTDIPVLIALWEYEESAVDFALYPGESVFDWISPNRLISSEVWLRDGVIVGYTRVKETEPSEPICFMAVDADAAIRMAHSLISVARSITLPLHPASASAKAFPVTPVVTSRAAGMACPLVAGVLDVFSDQVAHGERAAGRVIWPVMFEV